MAKITKGKALAVCVILAAALLLRVINLDADPSALISRDFITDEGWWAHNARNAVLYGQWRIDEYNLGLHSAYLYNLLLYVTFKLFGISFTTLRMLPALAGWLTVILLFSLVRREISTRAALFASVLVGFSNFHISYSRTGFPESTMVFFLVLMLWLWSLRKTHYSFAVLAGVAFALMLLTKITAIYLIPGFVLLIAVEIIRRSISWRLTLSFLCGVVLVGMSYAILFIAPNFEDWLQFNLSNASGAEWSGTSPPGYTILRLLGSPFYAQAPVLTALSLLAACVLVAGISRDGLKKTIRDAGDLEVTSAMLLIGYLLTLALTQYQPERRFLPALSLMVILSASVLEKGWETLKEMNNENHRMSPVGWFAVLFLLPTIGILQLKNRVLGEHFAVEFRLTKVVIIAGLVAVAVALSRDRVPLRFRRSLVLQSRVVFILLFSLLSLALVYKALRLWGLDAEAWRLVLGENRGGLLAVVGIVLGWMVVTARILQHRRLNPAFLVCAALFIEAIQISTWVFQPTYTLNEANEFATRLLTHEDTVVTHYETVLLSSPAKIICRSVRRGFNVDVFETSEPQYILVLRRDNWRDHAPEDLPPEERQHPAGFLSAKIASFDLCPVRSRGPRFSADLYSLSRRVKRDKKPGDRDSN